MLYKCMCKVCVNRLSQYDYYFLTRFSTKILVIRLANGGRAVGWLGGRILNGVKLRFPLNNFSLLWPIDTKGVSDQGQGHCY